MARSSLLVRARALTGFRELVSRHGGQAEALLGRVGISAERLDDPDFGLPLVGFAELLEIAAAALRLPDFGARLARYQNLSVLGPVALIAQHAGSVAEALERVARYMPYHSPGLRASLAREGELAVWHLRHDDSVQGEARRQLTELAYRVTVDFLRLITRSDGQHWQLSFQHGAVLRPARYRQLFGCQVRLNQPQDALVFPAELLETRMDAADVELREAVERSVRQLIQRHPLDLGRQVESLAERLLATGNCTLPTLAAQLGMPRHVLQRRLAAIGLQFEAIIDGLRRRRAEVLLPQSQIALTEVAFLLGYGDPSSLTRACYRWFGASPRAVRKRGRR